MRPLKLPVPRGSLPPPQPTTLDDYYEFVCLLAESRDRKLTDAGLRSTERTRFTLTHVNPKHQQD